MTGAYDELVSAGRLGPQCARMLYRAVQTVAIARNFPPPDGHLRWDPDAAMEVAHDFLDGERGRKRIADLVIRATDDASFERLLHAAVLNFHRDRSRRTDVGALTRRVSHVLNRSDLFQESAADPSRWHLRGAPATSSTARPPELARAAAEERELTVPRWKSERRRAPQADFDTFERLIRRVLMAAHGSLTAAQMSQALSARLDPRRVPLTVELGVLERLADRSADSQTEDQVVGRLYGADVFDRLCDRERILIATWEKPVRDLGEVLGVGHSQAATLRQRLAARLAGELAGDHGPEIVVNELRALATEWMRERTAGHGTAFTEQR
ncbi:MAG TPA: hypothetical protein VIV12_22570 [Streptosporangiaceae bacterium]